MGPSLLLTMGSGGEQLFWKQRCLGDPSIAPPLHQPCEEKVSAPCPWALRMVSSCLGLSRRVPAEQGRGGALGPTSWLLDFALSSPSAH